MSKRRKTKTEKRHAPSLDIKSKGTAWKYILPVLVLGFLAYANSLSNGFVNWDDPANFLDNPYISNPENLNLFQRLVGIFSTDVLGNYNPLSIASFLIDKAIFGFDKPWGWHLINLLLHLGVCVLVFSLSRALGMNALLAAITAFVFAVHPMHVESVSWVTERKDVLFALFYFAALIKYARLDNKSRPRDHLLIYLFFILSLLSKIQAVSLPLSMILVDYLQSGKIGWKSIFDKWKYFLLSLIVGITGIIMLQDEGSLEVATSDYNFIENIALGSWSLLVYLYKFIFPYPLSSYYPYPESLSVLHYISLAILPGLLGILLFAYKKSMRALFFGLAFFLANIIFVVQFVKAGQGFLADRFSYIPYYGLIYLTVFYLGRWFSFSAWRKNMAYGVTIILGAAMIYMTHHQNVVWQNGGTLWGNVIEHYPRQMRPYAARGNYHYRQGNLAKAKEDYTKALSIRENEEIYGNRAKAIMQMDESVDNMNAALSDINRGIELNPRNAEHFINRGVIYTKSGNLQQAMADYSQAIAISKQYPQAFLNRGQILKYMSRHREAIADFNALLQLQPTNAKVWYEKAGSELAADLTDQGIQSINRAISYNPQLCEAYILRSQLVQKKGDVIAMQRNLAKAKELGCY